MSVLDWKSKTLQMSRGTHPKLQTALSLGLSSNELKELQAGLEKALSSNTELRVELPLKWTLYFKPRAGGSRVSLAHPQADEWVATIYLAPDHIQRLVDAISNLARGGGTAALSALGSPGPFANFELILSAVEAAHQT